jgi:HEAT repeat protein
MEPVWGGQEDTAGPLRGICLLALPACPDLPRDQVLRHMVNALTEPSPTVRADAARALAEMQGDDCALLLRLKARAGDAEPAVTGQVLESLLALERRAALPFVRQFLAAADQVSEEAALALGGSRQSDAVDVLLESWPTARGLEYRQALLRALSISRHDRAIEFLKQLVAEGRPQDAADARAALELFPEKQSL